MCAGVHGACVRSARVHVCMCACIVCVSVHVCVCRKREGGGENKLHSQNKVTLTYLVSCEGVIPYLLCELMRDEWLCVLA